MRTLNWARVTSEESSRRDREIARSHLTSEISKVSHSARQDVSVESLWSGVARKYGAEPGQTGRLHSLDKVRG